MNDINKIFTFDIAYDGDEFGNIAFCAHTKSEAMDLYNHWCMTDMHRTEPFPVISVNTIYDADDANEYGDDYGSPSEYSN